MRSRSPRSPSPRSLSFVCLLTLLGSCATPDTGDDLRSKPPAPWVVSVDWDAGSDNAADFRYAGEPVPTTKAEAVAFLTQELRALDASSKIVLAGQPTEVPPDLELTFKPRGGIRTQHAGSSSPLGAFGLWLVSWIGGLLVPDSSYYVEIDATCSYTIDDSVGKRTFDKNLASDPVDERFFTQLSFFERNDFFSGPTLQSIVLPPFWTTDQHDKTGSALSQAAMRIVAREITALLKAKDFEALHQNALACRIEINEPVNGAAVTSSAIPIEITARCVGVPIKNVAAQANDGPVIDLKRERDVGDGLVARGELQGLRLGGANWVRVRVTTGTTDDPSGDRHYTRTLRLGGAQ